MNESDVVDMLIEGLYLYDGETELVGGIDIRTFEDVGMLTDNKGLVVKVGGKEFQISVVWAK